MLTYNYKFMLFTSCLLIAQAYASSKSLSAIKHRVERDTRNIPIEKFKPLQPSSSNEAQVPAPYQQTNETVSSGEFSVSNTAEASRVETQGQAGFIAPKFTPQRDFRPTNSFNEDEDYNNSAEAGFPRYYQRGPTRFYQTPPVPPPSTFGSRSIPLMSSGVNFPYPINSGPAGPLGSSRFSGSRFEPEPMGFQSSNNFYRSESYSYSSDGMGAPRVQHDVFDSRPGFGVSRRSF